NKSNIIFMELLNSSVKIPEITRASFGKLIFESIPLALLVLPIGEFMDSVIMDHKSVPEKAYTGYGIPVSVTRTVPELFRNIHTKAVVSGVTKAQIMPR